MLLGVAGLVLALDRLIPRRSARAQRAVTAPDGQERVAAAVAPEPLAPVAGPELPALEVPTMMFATQVEERHDAGFEEEAVAALAQGLGQRRGQRLRERLQRLQQWLAIDRPHVAPRAPRASHPSTPTTPASPRP